MARDIRAELEQADGTFPPTAQVKPGDVLVGELLRYDEGTTRFGKAPIAVLAIEGSGEVVSLWLLHTVLRNEFAKQRPRPGERIGLKRFPDSEEGYARWVLRIDRAQSDAEVPDFASYGQSHDDPGDVTARVDAAPRPAAGPAAPPAQRPFEARAAEEDLKIAVREAGGTTLALAKEVLAQHLPVTDFTNPEGTLDFSRLSVAQIHLVANRIRVALRRQTQPEPDPFAAEPPPLSDAEIPF